MFVTVFGFCCRVPDSWKSLLYTIESKPESHPRRSAALMMPLRWQRTTDAWPNKLERRETGTVTVQPAACQERRQTDILAA